MVSHVQIIKPEGVAELTRAHAGGTTPTIFDVGANRGQSYRIYRDLFPEGFIHCFEPDVEVVALLRQAVADDPRVTVVQSAISDRVGQAVLRRNSHRQTNSFSPIDPSARWITEVGVTPFDQVEVPTTTLDAYCHQTAIERIDILKLDVQAHEPAALAGARGLLSEGRIGLLQLELIPAPFYDRTTEFSDVDGLLHPYGYRLLSLVRLAYDKQARIRNIDAVYARPEGSGGAD